MTRLKICSVQSITLWAESSWNSRLRRIFLITLQASGVSGTNSINNPPERLFVSEKSQQPLCLRKFHSKFVLAPPFWLKNERNSEGIFFDCQEVMNIKSKIPVMSYRQYRRARKLVHECCNYDNGSCIGRWGRMYLCAKYFLLPAVQMVPHCCPSSGQAAGNGAAVPGGYETLYCLWSAISSWLQPGEILQALCGKSTPETEECQWPEKTVPMRTIRSENTLILLAFQMPVTGWVG